MSVKLRFFSEDDECVPPMYKHGILLLYFVCSVQIALVDATIVRYTSFSGPPTDCDVKMTASGGYPLETPCLKTNFKQFIYAFRVLIMLGRRENSVVLFDPGHPFPFI